jgi:hypothetical protein
MHAHSLVLPGQAGRGVMWRGEARRLVQAHDVRMNSSPKSDPKPRRSVASFYHLFLLRVCV